MQTQPELASAVLAQPEAGMRTADPEEQFLAALRERTPAAWTRLFEDHNALVFRAALAQVGERALAEDITAQVFLEAIEGIGRYRSKGRPIAAWLLAICRHRSIDAARKRARQPVILTIPAVADIPAVAGPAVDALGLLTADQRQVIHLRFVEDLSIEEVATLTNRSSGAVKSLQHRALRQLRALLEPNNSGGIRHA